MHKKGRSLTGLFLIIEKTVLAQRRQVAKSPNRVGFLVVTTHPSQGGSSYPPFSKGEVLHGELLSSEIPLVKQNKPIAPYLGGAVTSGIQNDNIICFAALNQTALSLSFFPGGCAPLRETGL
jgi:hypothetical protein